MSGALKMASSKLSKLSIKGHTTKEINANDSNPFSHPDESSDITLIVDGKHLFVSKLVLSLASPVFKALFKGEYKDKTMMAIPDQNYNDFVALLLCVYPSTNQPITMSRLEAVLNLAHEYKIASVRRSCEEMIQSQAAREELDTREELVHLLYLTDKYHLPQKVCMDKMKQRTFSGPTGYKYDVDFESTSLKTKYALISNRLTAFEAAVKAILKTDSAKSARLNAAVEGTCTKCERKHGHHTSTVCKSFLGSNMIELVEQIMNLCEIMK